VTRPERAYPRYAHEAAVTFRAGRRTFEGRTRNVSRGGLCAMVVDTIAVGSDLELDLVLVFDDDVHSDPLRISARVVWCTPLDEANQLGVAFRPLDARRAEQLELFLSYLEDQRDDREHAPPRRGLVDDRFG
jgi:hypothetical protein